HCVAFRGGQRDERPPIDLPRSLRAGPRRRIKRSGLVSRSRLMHLTGCARNGRGAERERALGRAICIKRIALAAVLLAYPVASVAGPIEDKALICAACHGSDGLPKDKDDPG